MKFLLTHVILSLTMAMTAARPSHLKRSVDFERKTTPYTVTLKGREVYAMFNQVGGRNILHRVAASAPSTR